MKCLFHLRVWLVLAGLVAASLKGEAQGFNLTANASTNLLRVGSSLTYNIAISNQSGVVLNFVQVTNTFSTNVTLVSTTNSNQGTYVVAGSSLIYTLGIVPPTATVSLTLVVQPATSGFLTNTITVADSEITNTATTNIVVQVVNGLADLGVGVFGPLQTIITNDLTSYSVGVTNFGPDSAPNVILTNSLPGGVSLKGASRSYTTSGSNQLFNLGTVASGSNVLVQIFIQPTNVAPLPITAAVGSTGLLDSNLTNNTATTNLLVTAYLPGTIIAVTNSAQILNYQNGLTEQSILLTNTGPNDAPAVRLVVSGLTNRLFNAVGTNGSSPFVVYSAPLATNQSATLLLQYFPRGSFPFTNGQLQAEAVPMPDWTPPAATGTSTNINISRIVPLANGNMLIEFPTDTNRTYTVVYSDNVQFSNAMIAPPIIRPSANRRQWIDYGPPTTTSAPTNAAARFYRVMQNP